MEPTPKALNESKLNADSNREWSRVDAKCQKYQSGHRRWQKCGTAKIPKWFLEVSEDRPQRCWTSLNTRQKSVKVYKLELRGVEWLRIKDVGGQQYEKIRYFISFFHTLAIICSTLPHLDKTYTYWHWWNQKVITLFLVQKSRPNRYSHWHPFKFCRKFCAFPHDSTWCKSDQRGCGASRRYHLYVSASKDWFLTSNKMRQVWTSLCFNLVNVIKFLSEKCEMRKPGFCSIHVIGFCCFLLWASCYGCYSLINVARCLCWSKRSCSSGSSGSVVVVRIHRGRMSLCARIK